MRIDVRKLKQQVLVSKLL